MSIYDKHYNFIISSKIDAYSSYYENRDDFPDRFFFSPEKRRSLNIHFCMCKNFFS